jgi:hypothetical protein
LLPLVTVRLGQILTTDYRVPEEALARALHFQRTSGTSLRIGEILVKLKVLPRRELLAAIGQQLQIPVVVGLARMPVPSSLLKLVTRTFAETRRVVPVGVSGPEGARRLLLAMADPTDAVTIDVVERASGAEVIAVVALEEEIAEAIEVFYSAHERSIAARGADQLTPPRAQRVAVPSSRRPVSPAATRSSPTRRPQPSLS